MQDTIEKLLGWYLAKNIYLAKIAILKINDEGNYENDSVFLPILVYKKNESYYNLINNEVYKNCFDSNVGEMSVFKKSKYNFKNNYFTESLLNKLVKLFYNQSKVINIYLDYYCEYHIRNMSHINIDTQLECQNLLYNVKEKYTVLNNKCEADNFDFTAFVENYKYELERIILNFDSNKKI